MNITIITDVQFIIDNNYSVIYNLVENKHIIPYNNREINEKLENKLINILIDANIGLIFNGFFKNIVKL